MCVCVFVHMRVHLLGSVWFFAIPWTVLGFPRQEYWSGLPFPPTGDLSDPAIETGSPILQEDSLPWATWEAHKTQIADTKYLCLHFPPQSCPVIRSKGCLSVLAFLSPAKASCTNHQIASQYLLRQLLSIN